MNEFGAGGGKIFCAFSRIWRDSVVMLRADLNPGVCPLFFPILVRNKHAAAEALRRKGIEAVEFWNDPFSATGISEATPDICALMFSNCRFTREYRKNRSTILRSRFGN